MAFRQERSKRHGDDPVHVYYRRGAYSGPLLRRPVTGRCVFIVHHRAESKPTNGFDLTCQVDVFLKVDNATASLITKSLQPLVGSTADHNFQESLRFVERLTRTTRNNGPGVKALGRQLKIDSEVRQGFDEVIDLVFQRAILQRGIDSPDGVAFPASPAISAEQPTAYVPGNSAAGSRPANSPMVDSIDAGPATTQVAKPPISEPNFNASGASNWLPAGSVRSRLTDAPLGSTVAPAGYRIPARGQQAPSYPAGNVFRGR